MELLEFTLGMRRQCRNSSLVSEGMYGGKGEVFKDQLDLLGIFLQHLLEQRLEPRTVRSLIIAKNGDDNRCALGALIRQSRVGKGMYFFELNNPYPIV